MFIKKNILEYNLLIKFINIKKNNKNYSNIKNII